MSTAPVNLNQPQRWKAAVATSVDMYNDWFMRFAPEAFRATRAKGTTDVEGALHATGRLADLRPATLRARPDILPTLRMSTCPPLAVDRLHRPGGCQPGLHARSGAGAARLKL